MKHHRQPHRKQAIIILLIVLLIIIAVWAGLKAHQYYNAPHTETSTHMMYLTIRTDKNLTPEEVVGYEAGGIQKIIIIQKGGINFYELSPGLNLTRELAVQNKEWYPVNVEVTTDGNLTNYLTIQSPPEIEPKSTITINLTASVPEQATAGKYMSNLTIKLTPKK